VVKVRDGQVTNRPIYVAIGVTTAGERDILGLWLGVGGEGAKYWLGVLTELKNRGVDDCCIVVCDGLRGLPAAITTTWPLALIQTSSVDTVRWRDGLAGHRATGRGPVQTRRLRGPHADLSLRVEAGRVVASGSRASSAVMRFQHGQPGR
jgi:putative transposase